MSPTPSIPIPIPSPPHAMPVEGRTDEMEELSTSPSSFCTATGTPLANDVPLPESPTLLGDSTLPSSSSSPPVMYPGVSPMSQPVRLPMMIEHDGQLASHSSDAHVPVEAVPSTTAPTSASIISAVHASQISTNINRQSTHLVRVHSHQQQVAQNTKQPKRVSSVLGLGGHFSPSPPGSPNNVADVETNADRKLSEDKSGIAMASDNNRAKERRESVSQAQQVQSHVRRRSSIQDILSVITSTSTSASSPTQEVSSASGRRRSIVSALLRKGSADQVTPVEPVGPKVIHESSPASTMLATASLPPRISSKRSTPNLGRPAFPSVQSSPAVPRQYAPFDPRYRPQSQAQVQAPWQGHGHAQMAHQGPGTYMHPAQPWPQSQSPSMASSPISPLSPSSPQFGHSPHSGYGFPMPPPHMPQRRPAPPAIHVPPHSRSGSPAGGRLSSPSTPSLRSSTPNLRSSFLGIKKEEVVDTREKRVSTLNLPPMGFTNTSAPKFSRAGARRSGIIMPTSAYGSHGGNGHSQGSRRPMSHLPSVSSLNTVDEMGTLGGGGAGGLRSRHSHMPGQSATTLAMHAHAHEGGRPVYKRSSTTSLSSMRSGSATSDVSASASQLSVRPATAASVNNDKDKDTLETLLESASASHSRQASADLPVPNAAFMRSRQGSAVSTDSSSSAGSSVETDADADVQGDGAAETPKFDAGASVPSLSIGSSTGSSNDHSSVPQTPNVELAEDTSSVPLPPRVDSRPLARATSSATSQASVTASPSTSARPSASVEEDDDAMEEVLAADDGYMRSLNARLKIDVRIEGTSRAASYHSPSASPTAYTAAATSPVPGSAFAPAPPPAQMKTIPAPHVVGSEDDDTELPYTRGSQSSDAFEFGILPSAPSMSNAHNHTIHTSPSFSRRFFGFGDKAVRGMSSFDSLSSVKSSASASASGSARGKMGMLSSFGSMSSLRSKDKAAKAERGRGQMREVTTAEAKSTPVPASAAPRGMESPKLGASEQGSTRAEIGAGGKSVKPKKSAVFLGKLGKAFGVKKRDKEVPPMPVAA